MLTKGAIEDLIILHLSGRGRAGASGASVKPAAPPKRVFLSDWELRRLYKPGERTLKVPLGAIISPLSADWLDFDGIQILRS